MTLDPDLLRWGPPTTETTVLAASSSSTIPDCAWEWKFSTIVDSVCADYEDLPSFMSLSWD